ncbi:kelch repeat-containing protein [uncultured Pontibacter sp.]|uniref:Kelch repeat-containing protein n=1 Tax=uncultured Pontibacter sp. TaxID=453356 RepID=UPI0026391C92|nr:kelch repeat-containing protein [uncultured Pontibacter sp.]
MKYSLLFLAFVLISTGVFAQLKFEPAAPMKSARGAIASAADTSFIYVANGYSKTSGATSEIEKYDFARNTWSVLTAKSIAKRFASAAIAGGSLYVFNGYDAHNHLNKKVEMVNLQTGAIQQLAENNPLPVASSGISVWDDMIYTFGGALNTSGSYSDKLFKFDPATNLWTELASMPEAKETKGAIVDGNLYVFGGFNGKQSRRIDKYDIQQNTWSHIGDMPVGVSANSIAVSGSKIYIVGDYTNQKLLACFDVNTFTLTPLQTNITGRRHAASHVVDGKLYVIGGNQQTPISSSLATVEVAEVLELN